MGCAWKREGVGGRGGGAGRGGGGRGEGGGGGKQDVEVRNYGKCTDLS